jgi:hypothetical protein
VRSSTWPRAGRSTQVEYEDDAKLLEHLEQVEFVPVEAVAVEGFAELRLILRNAREAAGSPEAALRELAEAYVGFALEHPALYDAMFTLSTELPFGRPEAPPELQAAFAELREAVAPLTGGRDPDTLTEVAWSALHGVAALTRARRLRPDYHQARLTMLADQLAGVPA